jgi:hypothetical protein
VALRGVRAYPGRCVVSPVVIAADPGARWTGVVARRGNDLLDAVTVERTTDEGDLGVGQDYLAAVLAAVDLMSRDFAADAVVAVEGLRRPSPHVRVTNPEAVMGAAMVLGAVLGAWPRAVVVPPGRHGSAPLAVYPPRLVGVRERAGTGSLRHVRSAWDVAGSAGRLVRAS